MPQGAVSTYIIASNYQTFQRREALETRQGMGSKSLSGLGSRGWRSKTTNINDNNRRSGPVSYSADCCTAGKEGQLNFTSSRGRQTSERVSGYSRKAWSHCIPVVQLV